MDLALLVYGISVIDKTGPVLALAIFITILSLLIALGYRFVILQIESWDGEVIKTRKLQERVPLEKWIKRMFGILALATFLQVIIPSEKTAYTMVGAYAAQKVAENDKVQQMSGKVLTIIEQKLDSYVEEGIKQAEKKVTGEKK